MKTLIGAAGALVLVGALVAAGCEPADGDCDARGTEVALTAMHAGKSGGRKSRLSKPSSRPGSPRRTSHGHHDHDDCD
ncbi:MULTISPECIES: hypothetical protein [Streptomyces]|uniref:Lipoprotein n=1 Tax=Streptomyces canarius TaxID=285453 RepID=A0ABQ3CJD9_9ACTN|nr:hypothetical protein [Streptomyces canarius]GHA08589.1 hypothetical protein GCM10010345_11170 [Streptomyces canarius]